MPSFTSILRFAAIGLAAFASVQAAPIAENSLAVRCDECKTLPTIVTDLTAQLSVTLAPIAFCTSSNATVEVIKPIVVEAKSIIVAAIADVKLLVGANVSVALGACSVIDFAGLLATLVIYIFSRVSTIIAVVVSVEREGVHALLCELLVVVAELLQLILSIVVGLLAVLLPLIINIVVSVCLSLKLTVVFGFLGSCLPCLL